MKRTRKIPMAAPKRSRFFLLGADQFKPYLRTPGYYVHFDAGGRKRGALKSDCCEKFIEEGASATVAC